MKKGLAVAALVLGIVGLVFGIVAFILAASGKAAGKVAVVTGTATPGTNMQFQSSVGLPIGLPSGVVPDLMTAEMLFGDDTICFATGLAKWTTQAGQRGGRRVTDPSPSSLPPDARSDLSAQPRHSVGQGHRNLRTAEPSTDSPQGPRIAARTR